MPVLRIAPAQTVPLKDDFPGHMAGATGPARRRRDAASTPHSRARWNGRRSAIGPKISRMAFGRDRRLPITSLPAD